MDEQYRLKYKNCLIGYSLLYDNSELSNIFIHLLELLGIEKKRLRKIDSPIAYSRVYLPEECFVSGVSRRNWYYTKEYQLIIEFLINKCNVDKTLEGNKVYFSREKIHDGRDYGEYKIREAFQKKGFLVYYPECISFEEQVKILQNCSVFVATEGSVAHNAVFLNKNAELVILRKAEYVNSFQTIINKAFNIKTTFIDINRTSLLFSEDIISTGPFFLYPSKYLCNYLNIVYQGFPYIDYLKYLIPLLRYRLKTLLIKKIIYSSKRISGIKIYKVIKHICNIK